MDIKLDATGDVDFTSGELHLVTGSDAVRQHWLIRMRHFKREWFLDRNTGVPWYEQILKHNANLNAVRYFLLRTTRETPGIGSVDVFTLRFDPTSRTLEVEVTGVLDAAHGGGKYEYKELLLPDQEPKS